VRYPRKLCWERALYMSARGMASGHSSTYLFLPRLFKRRTVHLRVPIPIGQSKVLGMLFNEAQPLAVKASKAGVINVSLGCWRVVLVTGPKK
jgi:hypothetical protein